MKMARSFVAVALVTLAPVMTAGAVLADANGCPPGLAKKDPPCVPPGQANKGVTPHQWPDRDRTGDVIDRSDLIYLDDFPRYGLPPLPDGQRYAVVDGQIVVIDPETYRILQWIRIFDALSN